MGGFVCVRDQDVAKRVAFFQNAEGTACSPMECFLFLRGIKTLYLRVQRAQENAIQVATFLMKYRPQYIKGVFFPIKACSHDAGSLAVHDAQCRGPGCVISLTTGSVEFSQRLVNACRIFRTTVSYGSVNSLIGMPATMSHASISDETRVMPADLIRLSIGIEGLHDLIADLEQAIKVAAEEVTPKGDDKFDSNFNDLPVLPRMSKASLNEDLAALLTKTKFSDDIDSRRLENAEWRTWAKTKQSDSELDIAVSNTNASTKDASTRDNLEGQDSVEIRRSFSKLQTLQTTIGACLDFNGIRFRWQASGYAYDELPTFPIRPNFATFKNQLQPASQCVVFDGCPEDPVHPSNTPIYMTATFNQPSACEFGPYDYSRSGNPTRTALEKHVAMLEQAAASFAFATGMAALCTVTRLLSSGDHMICNADIYGGMHRLLTQDCVHSGILVSFVDTADREAVERAMTPQTKLIHTESPSNPLMRITDLRALAELAHRHNAYLSVDSTMMPPVICKPLTLGVDIVVHSATKFFSGHADCSGGFVCVRDQDLAKKLAFEQNVMGTHLAPFECFLFLRGIKTMFMRVQRGQENAARVAAFLLKQRPKHVKDVYFPHRNSCVDSDSLAVHYSQSEGSGCVMSFTTGDAEFSRRLLDACRIFKTTVSFGSVNSLGEMPCAMSHASIPAEKRTLPGDLVRLSIGIEDANDLISDLEHAIKVASHEVAKKEDDKFDSEFNDLPHFPSPFASPLRPAKD